MPANEGGEEVVTFAGVGAVTGRPFPIAIDDGHSETKIAFLEKGRAGPLVLASFPSRIVRGVAEVDAAGAVAANAYRTYESAADAGTAQGEVFMVVPRGRHAEEAGDNRTQDYPTGERNRVLVHHAIHVATKGAACDVEIGTTLPYSDFHLPVQGVHGTLNKRLIDAKKANIARPVLAIDRQSLLDLPPTYTVRDHGIFSEGVAAFFDAMLTLDETGAVAVNPAFAQRFEYASSFAIVDIGGKTTDIVYGSWDGDPSEQPMINIGDSESLKAGALDAADTLESLIKHEFNVRAVADRESALLRRKISLYGAVRPIDGLVDRAVAPLAQKIREAVYRKAEDGSGLALVLFCGGGSVLMQDEVAAMFNPALLHIPDEPRFANARGILKMMLAE